MVFVRKVKTASGATAVQIAERVGGRDKVLEHLGSAHDAAELTALLASARDRLRPGQGELDLSAGRVPAGHAVITGKRHVVVWQVLTGNSPHLVALVRAGAEFKSGKLVERPDESGGDAHAA